MQGLPDGHFPSMSVDKSWDFSGTAFIPHFTAGWGFLGVRIPPTSLHLVHLQTVQRPYKDPCKEDIDRRKDTMTG